MGGGDLACVLCAAMRAMSTAAASWSKPRAMSASCEVLGVGLGFGFGFGLGLGLGLGLGSGLGLGFVAGGARLEWRQLPVRCPGSGLGSGSGLGVPVRCRPTRARAW